MELKIVHLFVTCWLSKYNVIIIFKDSFFLRIKNVLIHTWDPHSIPIHYESIEKEEDHPAIFNQILKTAKYWNSLDLFLWFSVLLLQD